MSWLFRILAVPLCVLGLLAGALAAGPIVRVRVRTEDQDSVFDALRQRHRKLGDGLDEEIRATLEKRLPWWTFRTGEPAAGEDGLSLEFRLAWKGEDPAAWGLTVVVIARRGSTLVDGAPNEELFKAGALKRYKDGDGLEEELRSVLSDRIERSLAPQLQRIIHDEVPVAHVVEEDGTEHAWIELAVKCPSHAIFRTRCTIKESGEQLVLVSQGCKRFAPTHPDSRLWVLHKHFHDDLHEKDEIKVASKYSKTTTLEFEPVRLLSVPAAGGWRADMPTSRKDP